MVDSDFSNKEELEKLKKVSSKSPYVSIFRREPSKEEAMLRYVLDNAEKGNPESVMKAIDKFGWEHWMMNIGDGSKGDKVDEIIRTEKPLVFVEFGAYCGYSAVRFSRLLQPGAKYYSIEIHPTCLAIASKIVDFAGLSDKVQFIYGSLGKSKDTLKTMIQKDFPERKSIKLDFVFIDHDKKSYLSDFKLLDDGELLQSGSIVVADNVIFPGAPDYLEYVRGLDTFTSKFFSGFIEYTAGGEIEIHDGLEISIRK